MFSTYSPFPLPSARFDSDIGTYSLPSFWTFSVAIYILQSRFLRISNPIIDLQTRRLRFPFVPLPKQSNSWGLWDFNRHPKTTLESRQGTVVCRLPSGCRKLSLENFKLDNWIIGIYFKRTCVFKFKVYIWMVCQWLSYNEPLHFLEVADPICHFSTRVKRWMNGI